MPKNHCYFLIMIKDFDSWNDKKKQIDKFKVFQHPKESEIWWCRIGVNIGSEIYGKGIEYTRPVLIINSESSENCICIPISSKIKSTKYSCIIKTSDNKIHTVLVFQIKSIDKRRLKEKIYLLDKEEYSKVKLILNKLFKI